MPPDLCSNYSEHFDTFSEHVCSNTVPDLSNRSIPDLSNRRNTQISTRLAAVAMMTQCKWDAGSGDCVPVLVVFLDCFSYLISWLPDLLMCTFVHE